MSDDPDTINRMASLYKQMPTAGIGDVKACLVECCGPEPGRRYDLVGASFIIGRSSKADFTLAADSISRLHVEIEAVEGGHVIKDLKSTNGTYVNGNRVTRAPLNSEDRIRIGSVLFRYLAGPNLSDAYQEELYRLMTRDSLTGSYNQRYLLECLDRETGRSLRSGHHPSLVCFDIDDLDAINRDHGNLTGDMVLEQIVIRLQRHIRHLDVLSRWRGDEFAMLLPEVPLAAAWATSERLRELMDTEPIVFESLPPLRLTISFGVANLAEVLPVPEGSTPSKALLEMTQTRLQLARQRGGNAVVGTL